VKTIGVVSDTHAPRKARELPSGLMEGLEGVDLIIHAGDINNDSVICELEAIAPVHAVAGNTDDWSMVSDLGIRKLLEVEGCGIGVIHGDGSSGSTLSWYQKKPQHPAVGLHTTPAFPKKQARNKRNRAGHH